jgi:cysteine desulfurase/selenocysteine lyase
MGGASHEAPRLVPDSTDFRPVFGQRDLFYGLEPLVYMNHAGISPPSALVKRAVQTFLHAMGRHGGDGFPAWIAQRRRLKGKLAALVGARGDREIALTQNTSRGIGDVALSFAWRPGDRVVLFSGEFPANVTPWQRAAAAFGAEIVMLDGLRYLTDEAGALADLERELACGVRLVAVSAVQFQTGLRMPIAEMGALCREHGARLFVDAVQAAGVCPIDVAREHVDFLAAGSHKWMMGLEGAGFVYASEEAAAELEPRAVSWLSHERPVDFLLEGPGKLRYDKPLRATIDVLEGGNLSAIGFAAVEASLDGLQSLGIDAIYEHVQRVNDALEVGAVGLGMRSVRSANPARRSGSLCLLPPEGLDVVALHRELGTLGVACAIPDGYLRLSPHWPNAVDEAEQVTLSLEEALRRVRAG